MKDSDRHLDRTRGTATLVHNITSSVAMIIMAKALLAAGAPTAMAMREMRSGSGWRTGAPGRSAPTRPMT
ncbi:MAG: hypothetical protein JJU19_09630 [Pararhodobacter sp.]|nr:hypothetical protein [Pararhodobacter sp.]